MLHLSISLKLWITEITNSMGTKYTRFFAIIRVNVSDHHLVSSCTIFATTLTALATFNVCLFSTAQIMFIHNRTQSQILEKPCRIVPTNTNRVRRIKMSFFDQLSRYPDGFTTVSPLKSFPTTSDLSSGIANLTLMRDFHTRSDWR